MASMVRGRAPYVALCALLIALFASATKAETLLQLNGKSSYVQSVVKGLDSGVFTATAWFWPDGQNADDEHTIVSLASSDLKSAMSVGYKDGKVYYTDVVRGELVKSNATFSKKQWHSLAVSVALVDKSSYTGPSATATSSHRRVSVYVDSSLALEVDSRLPEAAVLTAGAEYNQYVKRDFFSGLIDELRVYGTALTATEVNSLPYHKPAMGTPEAAKLVFYADFNDIEDDDTRGDVISVKEKVRNKKSVDVAYCDKITVALMPYDPLALGSVVKHSHPFTDALYTDTEGPLKGSSLTLNGANFANTPHLKVSVDGVAATVDYVNPTKLYAHLPAVTMSMQGTKKVTVTNGGTNAAEFDFTYTYSLGEDFADKLEALYLFKGNLVNSADDGETKHTHIPKNYGNGGPFLAQDRNFGHERALQFSRGERVEMASLFGKNTAWTMCMWLYAEPTTESIFFEADEKKQNVANLLELDSSGKLKLDGVEGATLTFDAWQFVCIQKDAANAHMYVSGKLNATMTALYTTHSMDKAYIGTKIDGVVDDFFAWHRVLTADEIQALYLAEEYAIELDGSSTGLTVTTDSSATEFASHAWRADGKFSIEMWVKPETVTGTHVLFEQATGVGCSGATPCSEAVGVQVSLVSGKVDMKVMFDSTTATLKVRPTATTSAVVTAGKWQLIQVVNTLTSQYIAVDGVAQNVTLAVGTGPSTLNTFYDTSNPPQEESDVAEASTRPITLGYGQFGSHFPGLLGEVRMWSKELSTAELATYASCPPKYTEGGLFQTFKFDGAMGSTISFGKTPNLKATFNGPKKPYLVWSPYGPMPSAGISWPETVVTGSGSYVANSDTETTFTIQARGKCSKLRRTGGDDVQAVLAGPLERHTKIFDGVITDNGDGTYYGKYSATMCGFYALRVEDDAVPVDYGNFTNGHIYTPAASTGRGAYDTMMAYLSPLKLYVQPHATDAKECYAYDAPDLLANDDLRVAYPGVPHSFTLQAVDKFGCPRTTGGDSVEVSVYGRWRTYPGTVVDHNNGKYTVTYVPHMVGKIYMAVKVGGEHVGTGAIVDPKNDIGVSLNYEATSSSPWCLDIQSGFEKKGSLRFNSSNYVMVRDADHLNPGGRFTAEAWVLPEAPYSDGRFMSKESPYSGKGFYFGLVQGKLAGGVYVGADTMRTLQTEVTLAPDVWSHVAMTYTGDMIKIYVNGAMVDQKGYGEELFFRANSQNVLIGAGFSGLLDEVRLIDSVKQQPEIVAGHNCPMAPEDVLMYYMFNDGAADATDPIVFDYSVNAHNGKLRGSTGIPQFVPMNSPSGVNVLDLSKTKMSGTGLSTAVAGVATGFTMDVYDQCGFEYMVVDGVEKTVSSVSELVTTSLFNTAHDSVAYPVTTLTPLPELTITQATDQCTKTGQFTAAYTPKQCGTVSIDVKVDGQSVPNAPFNVIVGPSTETSTVNSVASGVGPSVVAGLASSFTIHAKDAYGCQRSTGGDTFDVLLTRISSASGLMKGSDAVTVSVPVTDNGDGTYEACFTAPASGDYIIDIGRSNAAGTAKEAISGSPFMVTASAAPWRSTVVAGASPAARYEHLSVVYGANMYTFRGYGANKAALTDAYMLPLSSGTSWAYRQKLTITGMASAHEMRVIVDTASLVAAGKMRDDCTDVRFVTASGHVDVPFFMDPVPGCNSKYTNFWFTTTTANTDVYMYYGNCAQTTSLASSPSSILVSYDSFESSADLSSWSVGNMCSFPPSDPSAFKLSTFTAATGTSCLQVDALTKTGGSYVKTISSMSSYVLRGSLYDSDAAAATHWMSPNFDDCTVDFQSTKEFLPSSVAIGVNSASKEGHYATLYPWTNTITNRTASWVSLEIASDGTTVTYKVNEEVVRTTGAAGFLPMTKILLRGGDESTASMAAWDNVYVANNAAGLSVSAGTEEAVEWSGKAWSTLSTTGTQPPPRNSASHAVVGTKLYLMGGFAAAGSAATTGVSTGTGATNNADDLVWTFDFSTSTWSTVEPYGSLRPPTREDHSLAAVGSTVLMFGGRVPTTGALLSDLYAYDTVNQAYSVIAATGPSARFGHTAVAHKSHYFVFGGHTATGVVNEMWAFSMTTMKWAELTPSGSPPARFGHVATVSGSKAYFFGGATTNGGAFSDLWRYDLDYNTFTEEKPVAGPSKKADSSLVAYNSQLISFAGIGASTYYNDLHSVAVY